MITPSLTARVITDGPWWKWECEARVSVDELLLSSDGRTWITPERVTVTLAESYRTVCVEGRVARKDGTPGRTRRVAVFNARRPDLIPPVPKWLFELLVPILTDDPWVKVNRGGGQ